MSALKRIFTARDFDNKEFYDNAHTYRHVPHTEPTRVLTSYTDLRNIAAKIADQRLAGLTKALERFCNAKGTTAIINAERLVREEWEKLV